MSSFRFDDLIAPMPLDDFVKGHWGQQWLRLTRDSASHYRSLLSETDLEDAISIASKTPGRVEILQSDESATPASSHAQAIHAFKQGKSLRLNSINVCCSQIARLAREMEQLVSAPVNVNLYLSPGGHRALPVHYDTHDVYVAQLFGEKMWKVGSQPSSMPLENLPLVRNETMRQVRRARIRNVPLTNPPKQEMSSFTLSAGDFLYLPRGTWHEATSKDGVVSCHLTIGTDVFTYADLLSIAVGDLANEEVGFRRSLPFGYATHHDGLEEIQRHLAALLTIMAGRTALAEQAVMQSSEIFRALHRGSLENELLGSGHGQDLDIWLDPTISARRKEGLLVSVQRSGEALELIFGSSRFAIPARFEDACRFIARVSCFTAESLPGDLNLPEKTALVRQLALEGVVTVAEDSSDAHENSARPGTWLPHRIRAKSNVVWMKFDNDDLREPFFDQTTKRLMRSALENSQRTTGLEELRSIVNGPDPSGFIFHVSRCGSTLIANALKHVRDTVVISEAAPISTVVGMALDSAGRNDRNEHERVCNILNGLMRSYSRIAEGGGARHVFKFTSWNILAISVIRRMWPNTPVAIVIRDPVEVVASCLQKPTGWMDWCRLPGLQRMRLGLNTDDGILTPASFAARVLDRFHATALENIDARCRVVDYNNLNEQCVMDIAECFGLQPRDGDTEKVRASLKIYSKDPSGTHPFTRDGEQKRSFASARVIAEVEALCLDSYLALRERSADRFPASSSHDVRAGNRVGSAMSSLEA